MQLKMRRIGNSRGVILPSHVASRLSRRDAEEDRVEGGDRSEELELTLIGQTAVLTPTAPDELELQAALAYSVVKWRRRHLLERLALVKRAGPGSRLRIPSPFDRPRLGSGEPWDEAGER